MADRIGRNHAPERRDIKATVGVENRTILDMINFCPPDTPITVWKALTNVLQPWGVQQVQERRFLHSRRHGAPRPVPEACPLTDGGNSAVFSPRSPLAVALYPPPGQKGIGPLRVICRARRGHQVGSGTAACAARSSLPDALRDGWRATSGRAFRVRVVVGNVARSSA